MVALVNMSTMLEHASKHRYAVGCFNMVDVNSLEAIVSGAVSLNSPVIIAVAEIHFPYVDIEKMSSVITSLADKVPTPVALHLDHGQSLDAIMKAIRCGFTSVMYDGSELPLGENIARTEEIVRFAKAAGVTVEAELGHVGGAEGQSEQDDDTSLFTDPDEAVIFVRETRVDALAVAVGSAHGVYKRAPRLDFERLHIIKELTGKPLVLHGGSGISDQDFRRAISCGINKINVYTELSQEANRSIKRALAENPDLPYPELKAASRRGMEAVVIDKIKTFGSGTV